MVQLLFGNIKDSNGVTIPINGTNYESLLSGLNLNSDNTAIIFTTTGGSSNFQQLGNGIANIINQYTPINSSLNSE